MPKQGSSKSISNRMLAAKAGRRARPYRALLSQRDLIQDAWLHLLTKAKDGKLVLDWEQEATRARLLASADRHMIDRARREFGPDRNPKAGIKSIEELAEHEHPEDPYRRQREMREQREEWRKEMRELTPTERRFMFAFVKKKSLSAAYKLALKNQRASLRTAERMGSKMLTSIRAKLSAIQEMRARSKKK